MDPQSQRQPESFNPRQIVFLGEQDGPPERELKGRWAQLFSAEKGVSRAYLVRVTYEQSPAQSVALCLRAEAGQDTRLLEKVAKVFASMFGRHAHLDIMFINEAQERALAKRCRPFFDAASGSTAP